MKPIELTKTDRLIGPEGAKASDSDKILLITGIHEGCGGKFILGYHSERWNQLRCFRCGKPFMVSSRLKTYADLRAYFKRRLSRKKPSPSRSHGTEASQRRE